MKWVLRVGLTFSLVVVIGLLTVLPHALGNKVFTEPELALMVPVIDKIVTLPCIYEGNHGRFCYNNIK